MLRTVHHMLYPESERAICGALNTSELVWSQYNHDVTCSECNAVYEAFHTGLNDMLWRESMKQSLGHGLSKNRAL